MPLFGPKKSPPFEPFKSKTYLKCAVARIKQSTAAKQNENKVRAKELGALLRDRGLLSLNRIGPTGCRLRPPAIAATATATATRSTLAHVARLVVRAVAHAVNVPGVRGLRQVRERIGKTAERIGLRKVRNRLFRHRGCRSASSRRVLPPAEDAERTSAAEWATATAERATAAENISKD